MVEAIGRQLDRCDVCGAHVLRKDLVRTQVEFLAPEASNYLTYSSYSASGWSCDASDAGAISIGPYAGEARVVIDDSNTSTESFGSQTWDGSGTLRSTSAVDASSWTSLVFAVDAGPYHQETSPEMTFTIGLCDSDGSNTEQQASFTTPGQIRAWFTLNISAIPAGKSASGLYFYISTTSSNKWFADRMQVAKNATAMAQFAPTLGSAVDRTDTPSMTMRKVCKRCREPLLSKKDRYGRHSEIRTERPIAVDIQEY